MKYSPFQSRSIVNFDPLSKIRLHRSAKASSPISRAISEPARKAAKYIDPTNVLGPSKLISKVLCWLFSIRPFSSPSWPIENSRAFLMRGQFRSRNELSAEQRCSR